MKNIALILLISFLSFRSFGQDITGQWNGVLKVQGTQLRLVFNVSKTDNGLSSTMDSPDQGANGIPTTKTSFENSNLKITVASANIEYEGKLENDNVIVGTFKQGGLSFPMNLSREKIEKVQIVRPQEPTKPYPYYAEDIIFENKNAGISLAGTLTLPNKEGVFPAVILISGSGPQNRDEELFGHKPFLVLSDFLTKNGIAVLRYDDRGTGLSKGDFQSATTADFATDVESAVDYLKTRKEIDKNKIGLIGHSEGGLIAPMVANKSNDVSYIVLLAAPGVQGDKILLSQQKIIGKASGMSDEVLKKSEATNKKIFEIVNNTSSLEELKPQLTNFIKKELKDYSTAENSSEMSVEEIVKVQVNQIANPWMQYFIKYNPATALKQVHSPVLALNGGKDMQVSPKENLEAINNALTEGGNKNVTIKELPNLNHLFQESKTGLPNEYETIEQTFSPTALTEILTWIQTQTK